MDVTAVSSDAEIIPVRWEPCPDVRPDESVAALCATCGWPVEDHWGDSSPRTPARAA
jgi:hypothetical protein